MRHVAVADRTAVLDLTDTTFDRRYIALSRRASTLWKTGDKSSAFRDIDAILATDDMATEQKMEARLQRAERLLETGDEAAALSDLEAVIRSHRNFDGIEARAEALLADIAG